MAKDQKSSESKGEDAPEGEQAQAEPKQGFVKKLLGNKKLLIIAGAGLTLILLGGGAGAYFFLFSAAPSSPGGQTNAELQTPIAPPQVAFFDVPDIIVNIQSADGSPAYLKLSASLELDTAEEKAGISALAPRIVDQFQAYLRELRIDDLKGSAGVMRVKEELLRRTNVAAAPYRVRDVLLKQMIVQ
ncbi:MAG TPA: flagellar basal body-associated FliL family protein [Rhizomicrobium sp.]|jgi:flagellar FliL protein|nr:flagellar basal body-associated FliL family protein [Rhizomicrobium sp.]